MTTTDPAELLARALYEMNQEDASRHAPIQAWESCREERRGPFVARARRILDKAKLVVPKEIPPPPEWFWIVWSPSGPTPPRVRHADEEAARRAASDMAARHYPGEFYVLKATHLARLQPETITNRELRDPDDPPF